MDAVTQELKRLSTLEILMNHSSDDLLEAFLANYNQQNADWDEMIAENQRLSQALDGYKRQASTQLEQIDELKKENAFCREMALKAEEIANTAMAVKNERDRLKTQVAALQKELTALKGGDNPKKLREQVKRLKEKSGEKDKKITRLETEAKQYRHDLTEIRRQQQQGFAKISELKKQLAHDTGSGLYHNGEHHLIIWPQKTKMQDADGNIFEGRSLLYLHQSGRGGLMTYNPETSQVNLCAAPRGGLRPSEELKDFANNWLFKVNVLQDGIVKEEDMIAVNYNPEFDK
ncbi:hypothetical protein [Vibrio parahaemolyticus]|uniref:hypothetical protein n=1 Tax=Vibrio parahaemolyticus TaxID=670 RepID=UPI0011206162|nr:hypothetical protein [Vibrio parahaemolyticus]TPB41780.1 hypothetical protein DXJ78_24095 [Vibrio parahaemolyticus]